MNFEQYQDYLIDTATSLLSIDSASGFTSNVADYLLKTMEELGYPVFKNNIGNVIVTIEGEDNTEPVASVCTRRYIGAYGPLYYI